MSCENGTYNLCVKQGDIIARTFTFTYIDDEGVKMPYAIDMYDEVKMQIRKKPGTAIIAEGSLTDGNFVISGPDLNVLEMSGIEIPGDTPGGMYLYDIEFSNVGDNIRDTLISGTVTIIPQITE